MTLGYNEYAYALMRAWICMYLFGLLFGVQVVLHEVANNVFALCSSAAPSSDWNMINAH